MPPEQDPQKAQLKQREETAQQLIDEFMGEWSYRLVTEVHKVELEILRKELQRILPEKLNDFVQQLKRRLHELIEINKSFSEKIQQLQAGLGEAKSNAETVGKGLEATRLLAATKKDLSEEASRAHKRETELDADIHKLRGDILGLGKSSKDADKGLEQEFSAKLAQQRRDSEDKIAKLGTAVEALNRSLAELKKDSADGSKVLHKALDRLRTDMESADRTLKEDLSHKVDIFRSEFKKALSSRVKDLREETDQRFEEKEHQLRSLLKTLEKKEERLSKAIQSAEERIAKEMRQARDLAIAGIVLAMLALGAGCCAIGYLALPYIR